ncbi:MAG: 23S rRNA (cytosine(1962)-C(5))-methyltransferase RlmI [Proteobacteria bacterium]|nr:MAG: 23S rRNA (cytosine(1962)-C(5))-methyltransferase RlmI [Pseudomonadota bacterium]
MDAARAMPDRAPMLDVILKPERDRSVRRRHPWVLSGAVERVEGASEPGAWARVVAAGGETLGFGHWSPVSQIRVRMLRLGETAPGDDWIAERIAAAVARRAGDPLLGDTDAVRLVNAEGDGLPGLVVDRYADLLVVRISTAGMHVRSKLVADALRRETGAAVAIERPDAAAARREGIAVQQGVLWGEPPAAPVEIRERERRYRVDVSAGQKTGFYLDQRDSRDLVQQLARGRRVLDLFSYTGGFAVAAAHGGAASIALVESSAEALAAAEQHLAPWHDTLPLRFARDDAFRFVRQDDHGYDLLVVDPPPLARRASDVAQASRAYKDVLLHALRRAAPGAYLLAFSCSHHVGPELFRKIAFGASLDAGRPLQVLRALGAPADHPVALDHPEGHYLSGLLLRA